MSRRGAPAGTGQDYTADPGKIPLVPDSAAPATPSSGALPTPDDVMAMLRGVIDPELGSDIVDLGMAKGATVADDGRVVITIALTTAGCPLRAQIQKDVRTRIGSLPGVAHVKLDWTELNAEEKAAAM